jgi:hypothetical protein
VGEKENKSVLALVQFNGSLKVDFQGSRITSDRSLLLVRDVDGRLGSASILATCGRARTRGLRSRIF